MQAFFNTEYEICLITCISSFTDIIFNKNMDDANTTMICCAPFIVVAKNRCLKEMLKNFIL